MTASDATPPAGFAAADLRLLDVIRGHDRGLRTVLCTLARHGVALRRDQPQRATTWLDELAPHPMFKGGQFLFDLLEWEDFMLDGDAPPVLGANAVRLTLDRLAAALRVVGAGLEGIPIAPVTIDLAGADSAEDLPALEAGFYLYHDVVLGALSLWVDIPKA